MNRFRDSVREKYSDVATRPSGEFHFLSGREAVLRAGYAQDLMRGIPEEAIESFCGVANPFTLGPIYPGEAILDVGGGSGTDALIAARKVGPLGQVTGVDISPAMVVRAEKAAARAGANNVHFLVGLAERLPLPDTTFDAVMSNGTINLCPDKPAVFDEMYRVLRPGGRVMLADLVSEREVPRSVRDLIYRWTSCVAGSMMKSDVIALMTAAGFEEIQVVSSVDIFDGARGQPNAEHYGVLGFTIHAAKTT